MSPRAKKIVKRVLIGVPATLLGLFLVLVVVIQVRSRRRFDAPLPNITASRDPAVIARGEYIVQGPAHCTACHVPRAEFFAMRQGQRLVPRGGFVWDLPFGTFVSPNITSDRETGVGQWSDAEIARAVRHGVARDGHLLPFMSFALGPWSDEDLTAIVSYLRSIAPVRNAIIPESPNLIGRALVAFVFRPARIGAPVPTAPPRGPTPEYGRYLASGAVCEGCHTRYDQTTFAQLGPSFGGGSAEPSEDDPAFELCPPNITRDATGVLANMNEQGFIARIRAGRRYHDSHMPWENFNNMTDDDLRAIYRYLQTVPPVHNVTGPARRRAGWTAPGT